MQRIVVFGNAGSGKSTLAKEYTDRYRLSHLDLDVLAWQDTNPPQRISIINSSAKIDRFLKNCRSWVIEGCYSDLLRLVLKSANEIVFLDPGVDICIDNCKKRPWEPHKYATKEDQDRNLDMLIKWVRQYPIRNDEFSLSAHRKLFNGFAGKKTEYRSNGRNA